MKYNTEQIVEKLRQFKLVPVIALQKAEEILPLADTLASSGLPLVEITFRSDAAAEAIRLLRQWRPEILIAAGTVLTPEQVIEAKEAGADVIVSPGLNLNIVRLCQALNLPIIPGASTPTEIESALELGLTAVKFFPAEASGGVKMIKALIAPYSNLQIMPTGGINSDNLNDYLAIPNVVACGGSWFVEKQLIASQNWQEIGRLVKDALSNIK